MLGPDAALDIYAGLSVIVGEIASEAGALDALRAQLQQAVPKERHDPLSIRMTLGETDS